MAFRFIFQHNEKPIETSWYAESASMTAPMLMSQLRSIFPDAAVSIERANQIDVKPSEQALEEFKSLKE